MNNLSEFKLRYINNPYSNKDTFFIFDELSILLKSLTSDELKKIGTAKNLADRQLNKQRKRCKGMYQRLIVLLKIIKNLTLSFSTTMG